MEEGLGMAEVKIRSDSSKRKRDQIMAAFDCAIGFVIIYIEEQLGDNLTWELATYTSGRRVEREFISLECTWWERNQSERRDWLESLSQFKTESGRFFIIIFFFFVYTAVVVFAVCAISPPLATQPVLHCQSPRPRDLCFFYLIVKS
jgi:hypothetical protein